jgi:hypothetical protein
MASVSRGTGIIDLLGHEHTISTAMNEASIPKEVLEFFDAVIYCCLINIMGGVMKTIH